MNETTTEERIVSKDRAVIKNLLQHLTNEDLTDSDQFRAAIKQFNVTTARFHDRGKFYWTTFSRRYLVEIFSPDIIDAIPCGIRYEFNTERQAIEFAAKERCTGDAAI